MLAKEDPLHQPEKVPGSHEPGEQDHKQIPGQGDGRVEQHLHVAGKKAKGGKAHGSHHQE